MAIPDFNGGATSLNTSQPIIYSSSNTAVATIVNGNIHITGAGTADITASQASRWILSAGKCHKDVDRSQNSINNHSRQ